ncbi:unnamed protein product [Ceratitis capitata]|uniref:(Mediterranean fruit fly) hypothetical protein n=1 Tax=Ceratitis capitata TaxID=7213 RepID=A0A811U7K6_CERCA|nr:unnamed protein product [Ceratitis capitata]
MAWRGQRERAAKALPRTADLLLRPSTSRTIAVAVAVAAEMSATTPELLNKARHAMRYAPCYYTFHPSWRSAHFECEYEVAVQRHAMWQCKVSQVNNTPTVPGARSCTKTTFLDRAETNDCIVKKSQLSPNNDQHCLREESILTIKWQKDKPFIFVTPLSMQESGFEAWCLRSLVEFSIDIFIDFHSGSQV